jgi:hypothetical protein
MNLNYGDRAARDLAVGLQAERKARAVATSIAAYAASNGTLTASANGAIGAQDGITLAAGDVLFLQEGLSNVTAADAGPYTVVNAGGAAAKFVLSRPSWWKHGALIAEGAEMAIGTEGTLFAGTMWRSFVATAAKVIGTDAPAFFPKTVTQQVVLVSGVATVQNFPVRGGQRTTAVFNRTTAGGTLTNTVQYNPSAITGGVTGTGAVTIQSQVAAGTVQNLDTSTGLLSVQNW